jgi:hypothetical protein
MRIRNSRIRKIGKKWAKGAGHQQEKAGNISILAVRHIPGWRKKESDLKVSKRSAGHISQRLLSGRNSGID